MGKCSRPLRSPWIFKLNRWRETTWNCWIGASSARIPWDAEWFRSRHVETVDTQDVPRIFNLNKNGLQVLFHIVSGSYHFCNEPYPSFRRVLLRQLARRSGCAETLQHPIREGLFSTRCWCHLILQKPTFQGCDKAAGDLFEG
jgi:hypothetical protein